MKNWNNSQSRENQSNVVLEKKLKFSGKSWLFLLNQNKVTFVSCSLSVDIIQSVENISKKNEKKRERERVMREKENNENEDNILREKVTGR